jgi:hypothetical protein
VAEENSVSKSVSTRAPLPDLPVLRLAAAQF